MKEGLLLILLSSVTSIVFAQLPETNVYSFFIQKNSPEKYSIRNAKFLNAYNLEGYNNQPSFIKSKTIFLSVQKMSGDQTDIYSLDLSNRKLKVITDTPESEYSPTLMPDGNHFSCVRVEKDSKSTQRLWKFPLNRSNQGQPIFEKIVGVGYHCWLSPRKVALFIVGDPHRLVIADTEDQNYTELTSKIGRGMQKLPNGNLAYVQKLGPESWYIKELDVQSYRSSIIIETLKGSEDFILHNGTYMMAKGSEIFAFHPQEHNDWIPIFDLASYGIKNITRLSLNSDNLLVVIDKKGL